MKVSALNKAQAEAMQLVGDEDQGFLLTISGENYDVYLHVVGASCMTHALDAYADSSWGHLTAAEDDFVDMTHYELLGSGFVPHNTDNIRILQVTNPMAHHEFNEIGAAASVGAMVAAG